MRSDISAGKNTMIRKALEIGHEQHPEVRCLESGHGQNRSKRCSPKQAGLDKLRAAIQGNRGFIFATRFALQCSQPASVLLLLFCLHEELHFG